MASDKLKKCKHLWVNQEGCLLCSANWEQMNKEGYVFVPVNPSALPEYLEVKNG